MLPPPTQSDVKHQYWEREESVPPLTPPQRKGPAHIPTDSPPNVPSHALTSNPCLTPRARPLHSLPLPLWLTCP